MMTIFDSSSNTSRKRRDPFIVNSINLVYKIIRYFNGIVDLIHDYDATNLLNVFGNVLEHLGMS